MRTSTVLLTPIAVAFLFSAMAARAQYTEHWMTNAEVARAQPQPQPAASRKTAKSVQSAPRQTAAATAGDDPIAAFAQDSHSQSNTARR
ncbi:hypothetical protein AWB75_05983 [Caballeronia catudaia]|uniref:Lipoprotein n=1 Tax=Caballeronia catudaia TaxID=1777136 RepID=A0A158CZH3_9BURK|nr:hypothetical protein [Caballeronia catudaia]SAK87762.1 hypothetical protein AWB75_05983 [Caballeronia catudaia]